MSKGRQVALLAGCCALAALVGARDAAAFFPIGGFNQFGQVRYAVWPAQDFDTNNNGVVEPGEGLEIRYEGGPRGFTADEVERMKAGFQVWADVPTSYASFRFVGPIEDPITPGFTSPDYLPTVFMQVTSVPEGSSNIEPDDVGFILPEVEALPSVVLTLYAITDVPITSGGSIVTVPAGNILDSDIVVNASVHRSASTLSSIGALDLTATIVSSAGLMLGLGLTPLNNVGPLGLDALGIPTESPVLQFTGPDGVARMVGATPSMFTLLFLTEDLSGTQTFGAKDLAPDDISGVSWLYPREDGQENFFTVAQEARTHTRRGTGIPSAPVSGAHIVAWADVSNGGNGQRIPLFSTMSGLYTLYTNKNLVGKFYLPGVWKQLEIPSGGGAMFEPSYVMTMNPLNSGGVERQAPPGTTPGTVDTLQGSLPFSYTTNVRSETEFATNYPSEVFNEDGNIYGIENNAAGTPLVWDFKKNKFVSQISGKTLASMLPLNRPMFGDPNDVCPMNVLDGIGGTGGIDTGNIDVAAVLSSKRLRAFRDGFLMKSAAGTALVDLYYTVSPAVARLLVRNPAALDAFRRAAAGMEWLMSHWMLLAALAAAGAACLRVRSLRTRKAAALALAGAVLLFGFGAGAQMLPISAADFTASVSDIFVGKVVSTQARWYPPTSTPPSTRIFTDVVVDVSRVEKGDINAGSQVSFSVIGGQIDGFVMSAAGIPKFTPGEEAVFYMVRRDRGLILYGGDRGKQVITPAPAEQEEEGEDEDAGEEKSAAPADPKVVQVTDPFMKAALDAASPAKAAPEASDGGRTAASAQVPLEEYLAGVRKLVREGQRATGK
ncbi:MAG TPA: hypothetical protein PL005_05930 [Candidatus Hydrogenedentes bacterium]|nr:hypothetical protein [Candidatus Hydrogenedentota bacterium]HQL94196.1 hypothetical protein [Candidatus Hydrogenedentota bacterium]